MQFWLYSQANKGICHAGASLVAAICLRTPDNAKQVIEAGGAEVLVQVLQTHMKNAKVAVSLFIIFHANLQVLVEIAVTNRFWMLNKVWAPVGHWNPRLRGLDNDLLRYELCVHFSCQSATFDAPTCYKKV